MPNPEMFGPASLTMGQGVAMFQTFLPKFTDIRQHVPGTDESFERDCHMGMIAATLVTMGIGSIASNLMGSPVPAAIAFLVCIGLVGLYEAALRSNGEVSYA